MNKQFLKDALGWGFILWLVGYILGFVFFAVVPPDMIGWVIMPIGTIIALWVLFKKVHPVKSLPEQGAIESQFNRVKYYLFLGIVWTLIAIVFDYIFLVKILKPADGYYKFDVYLYYALTFILPVVVGWRKKAIQK